MKKKRLQEPDTAAVVQLHRLQKPIIVTLFGAVSMSDKKSSVTNTCDGGASKIKFWSQHNVIIKDKCWEQLTQRAVHFCHPAVLKQSVRITVSEDDEE